MKVIPYVEGIRLTVFREYMSPSRLLSGAQGTVGIIDTFDLRRVAGHIGYIKGDHSSIEAETLDKAVDRLIKV